MNVHAKGSGRYRENQEGEGGDKKSQKHNSGLSQHALTIALRAKRCGVHGVIKPCEPLVQLTDLLRLCPADRTRTLVDDPSTLSELEPDKNGQN
jgi:hypothetical protein